jgi:hypothetical protein
MRIGGIYQSGEESSSGRHARHEGFTRIAQKRPARALRGPAL